MSIIDWKRFVPPAGSEDNERRWEEELAQREASQRRQERAQRLESASDLRLTDDVHRALLDGSALLETESLRAAKRWALGGERPCLILCGGTGCGKSVGAAWILAQLGGVWLPAERACHVFAAHFGDGFATQTLARDCPMLMLDDVGIESDPARMLQVLTELLDCRKSRRHRTVITTNLPKVKFEARYKNERLWSRMAETVSWSGSSGKDLRLKQTLQGRLEYNNKPRGERE